MVKGIFHINIVCSNLETSLHFYRDLLGARVVAELGEGGMESKEIAVLLGFQGSAACKGYLLRFGAEGSPGSYTTIDLLQWIKPQVIGRPYESLNHVGITRICLPVDDLDMTYQELKDNGAEFLSPPVNIALKLFSEDISCFRMCCVKDPDGVILELSGPVTNKA